jgi:hypothetical protein
VFRELDGRCKKIRLSLPPTAPLVPWPGHAPGDQFRFVGVSNHQRQYASG